MKIEEQLLNKHARSQAKIQSIRLKQQRREAESLQPAPRINKTSKDIIDILEGKADNTVSGYANKIVSTSRSSSNFMMHPKHSHINLALLDTDAQSDMPISTTLRAKHAKSASQSQFSIASSTLTKKILNKTRQDSHEIEHVNGFDLKKAIALRQFNEELFKNKEVEEKCPDVKLYEMSVIERNEYWNKRKNKKIQDKIENKINCEIRSCTFTPELAPKVNLNFTSRPDSRNSNSYAQRHLKKNSNTMNSTRNLKKDDFKPPHPPMNTMIYKALSPHCKTIKPSASLALFQNAIPMIPYKTK